MIQNLPNKTPKIKYDGSITIAEGKNRHAITWKNRELLWSEMVERLSQTTRTRETYAEYEKMTKARRDEIKDIGGFVGGALKNGRRKTDHINWRSLLTLDADYVKGDLWAAVEVMLGCACVVYSTHSHSPSSPRLRLAIPLIRPITPDEYQAVARRVAADLGIDFFDDTTYQPHRLMYWPSTSIDGEYVFKYLDAPWLDPDEVLARYPDWRDSSYWPESSRTKNQRKKMAEKQGDPTEKSGLIGAFCRTYSVPETIEKFLNDIYTPVGPDRYTYIPGTSTGGLVIYDDGKFAYSHHATDPISGQLVNSFDLVRIHKFGELDEDVTPETPTVKLPSYLAMLDFAKKDENVKRTLAQERLEKAAEDFADGRKDWTTELELNKKGEILPSLSNLVLILRNDPNLQGIAYNAHRGTIVLLKPVPWRKPEDWRGPDWSDDDDDSLQVYIEKIYNIYAPTKLKTALVTASHERAFHPIRDYLNSLKWDGIPRVDTLLIDYLGAEESPYVRAVTRKTLVAAAARVMNPGCKFDYMLVLVGPQGIGKSTFFERLGRQWFSDSLSLADTKDKTAAEKLQGYWIMEISELAGIKKAEIEAVKSFLSRQRDIYRPAYGRRIVEHPRQCIIVGSTNADSGFLRDSTGNRRFWPVNVTGPGPQGQAPWDLDRSTIDQIWAEALEIWKKGEPLYLEGAEVAEAIERQKAAMEADERLGMIREYLDRLLPEDWETRSIAERRMYIQGGDFGQEKGTVQRDRVCVAEIWCECFGKDLAAIKRFDMDEIHSLMRQIEGWERYIGNKDGKLKFGVYGVQRAYINSKRVADRWLPNENAVADDKN